MKKKLTAFVACVIALCCIAALMGCAETLSEVGEWKLSFFGDGDKNYSVGDEYLGNKVTETLYSCTFDGAEYKVFHNGTVIREGSYSAENAGEKSVLLALNDGGARLYWNLGVEMQADGRETLRIIAEIGGKTVCFIPA